MKRERILRFAAAAGTALTGIGAALYAINSPRRALAYSLLLSGAAVLAVLCALRYRQIGALARKRSSRYGFNTFLMIAAFASIAVIVQALSARHAVRYDVTRNKRFSLAAQTTAVLRDLSREIEVTAFLQEGHARGVARTRTSSPGSPTKPRDSATRSSTPTRSPAGRRKWT